MSEIRALRQQLYLVTSIGILATGIVLIIGPRSPSGYVILNQVPGGVMTWAIGFIVVGVAKLVFLAVYRWGEPIRAGSTLGCFITLAWALGLMLAGRRLQSWASVVAWLTIATVQWLGASTAHGS